VRAYSKKAFQEDYQQVLMVVSPQFDIRRLLVILPDQSTMEFSFDYLGRDVPLSRSLFRFTPRPGPPPVTWMVDQSAPAGLLRVRECVTGDACFVSGSNNDVGPGGSISIQFTATTNATISSSPVPEVWTTTAFSDSAYANSLPLAGTEPTVAIGEAPAITSANNTTFTYGAAGTFTVTTTGVPTPTLGESGSLPSGVTFTDNGDGTATLAGTPGAAGSFALTVTAHNGYGADGTQNFTLGVNMASQTITFTTNAPSSEVYNGSFTVAATAGSGLAVAYTSAGSCGNVGATYTMTSGTGTCSVIANQAGNSNYSAAPQVTRSTKATKATPTINWTTPAAITYGTALSATQHDATATYKSAKVAGTFVYRPASGTVLTPGTQTLSVTFTPTNTTDYTTATDSVAITVNKARPKITWATPAAITYGTPLSGAQLDATASVPGTFTYSPAAGTVLSAGTHTLSVTFTPSVTNDYTTATDSVTLTVNP
jgi:hypothetical protein